MPTYTINGKKIKTDRALTEDEIDEISNSLSPQKAEIPVGGDVAPAPVSTMSGGERAFQNALAGAAAVPPLAAAARGLQALTQGSKAAPYISNLARSLIPQSGKALAAEGAIGAAAGAVGGEVGQQVAQKAGEQYRPLGEMAGGMAGGLAANTVGRNVPSMVQGMFGAGSQGKAAQQAADLLGSAKARQTLGAALEANPNLAGDLQRAEEIFQQTGVRLPVGAATAGDTTIAGLVASQTSKQENSAFTALLANQEREAKNALVDAQKKLAASPKSIEAYTAVQARKAELENLRREYVLAKQQEQRQARVDDIDSKISELSSTVIASEAGANTLGNRVSNLLEAKKQLVKKELQPQYDELLSKAKEDGVQMNAEQVAGLYQYVKNSRAEDVFADFPGLASKIQKVFAPKPVASSKFQEKYPNLFKTEKGTFSPANIDDIDSLKREINKSLRSTSDPDKIRRLNDFKRQFDSVVDTLPDDFVSKYRDLDKQYLEKLGMPFSQNGVLSVNRANFIESTVPMLTTKPSAIRELKAATEGVPGFEKVVEEAFLFKLSNSAGIVNKETGQVNPIQLNAFLKANKETLDEVPGLRDRLSTLSKDVSSLITNRTQVLEQQKAAQLQKFENVWSQAYNTKGGFEGFVRSSLTNPQEMASLLKLAGGDKQLREGLKSSVLDLGMKSSNKAQFFKENEATINTLFGAEHAQKVQALLEASQRLAQFPLGARINVGVSQRTGFQETTGSSAAQIASEVRNPILGTFRTGANILSRFLQNRSNKAESAEIQAFLKDSKAVADAAELLALMEQNTAKGIGRVTELGKKLAKNTVSSGIFGGLAPVITGELGLSARQPVVSMEEE